MANRNNDPADNPSGNDMGNRGAGDNNEMNPAQPLSTGMVGGLGDRSGNAQGGVDPDAQNLRTPASGNSDRQWLDEEDDEL